MRTDDIISALDIGKKWTRQIKAEERRHSARARRESMWTVQRIPLKEICWEHMAEAWNKASDNGRLPTHWRMVFYVMRPLLEADGRADRPLIDATFKNILEEYLDLEAPGWDVVRGARGVFKEPHAARNDSGLAMSTMNVRNYLGAAQPDGRLETVPWRYPTRGARNRIAAVLICEKEGFDELLQAEHVPDRFDLALMSTKGISARAARDLAESIEVPCFTLHDLDKNGFVMAAGFPFATDLGIRMEDAENWALAPETQRHKNPGKTAGNLRYNGATDEEAEFIAYNGQRVELNMLSGPDFIEFVEGKLRDHNVEKVIPDGETLTAAWKRAHQVARVNRLIYSTWPGHEPLASGELELDGEIPDPPDDLAGRIRDAFEEDDIQSWDEALYAMAGGDDDEGGAV
jgi:hypothetical protein